MRPCRIEAGMPLGQPCDSCGHVTMVHSYEGVCALCVVVELVEKFTVRPAEGGPVAGVHR